MKSIWNMVNDLDVNGEYKNKIFIASMVVINMIIGAVIWGLCGRLFLPGIEYFICFVGYPAVFLGFFGGVLYLYSHEFA